MSKYHINSEEGTVGLCRAFPGNCPFGSEQEHFSSKREATQELEQRLALEALESGIPWPPEGLPKRLLVVASAADLLRHFNDSEFAGGEGVCLGASAFMSYQLSKKEIPHELVRGDYVTSSGELKAHWWLESSGWIIDPSRGQFQESRYRSGVTRAVNPKYRKLEAFQPGHNSLELVQAELNGCFYDESEAEAYLHSAFAVQEEAERIFG